MDNNDTRAGWQYHEGTKHPKGALLNPWHRFDPASQPLLYKQYLDVEAVPLPEIQAPAGLPALAVLAGAFGKPSEGAGLDINVLAGLLFYSAGITKRIRYPWGEMAFRAAACTGALYHIELYVVCGDLPGLPAGVYHFDPIAMALDILRKGDYRAALVQASGGEPSISKAPAVIVYSDVFWRNACKYQARAYRHSFWDSGTIVAHSRAIAGAYSLPARLVLGFVDEAVNQLLGLEDRKEAALALMAIGEDGPDPSGPFPDVKELAFITRPVSRFELDFPAIHDMHAASSLREPAQVRAWREGEYPPPEILPVETVIPLDPLAGGELPDDPLGEGHCPARLCTALCAGPHLLPAAVDPPGGINWGYPLGLSLEKWGAPQPALPHRSCGGGAPPRGLRL